MKRVLVAILLAISASIVSVGCSEKTKVQETKTSQGPGGTTKETTTHETTKSGESPPPEGNPPPEGKAP